MSASQPLAADRAAEWSSFVSHLECSATGARVPAGELHNLSPAGKPLLVRYDLPAVRAAVHRDDLQSRPENFWRYREVLPLTEPANMVSLGECMTPILSLDRVEPSGRVFMKDESRLPTCSFKARGFGLALSMARELGVTKAALPTNGNAGAAFAAYGARAGMDTTVFCPVDTPAITLREIAFYGAHVQRVNGHINDCGRLIAEGREEHGWFDISTLKEPYRVEGKKTTGYELAEQLGWRLPDVIVYATGGGSGVIGMWKAFEEMEALGWIGTKRPRMVAVQSTGCAPIVRAFDEGADHAGPWQDAATVAAGIRVPAPIGDFLILRAIRESNGFAIAIDDETILATQAELTRREGLLVCPEGASTYAAYRAARRDGRIAADEEAMLFNCASGVKYPMPDVVGETVEI